MNPEYSHWHKAYNSLHTVLPKTSRKPVIGITGNFGEKGCELAEGYYTSVLRAGATPFIIPPHTDLDSLTDILSHIDGLLLSGGADVNPLLLGEEPVPELQDVNPPRDLHELLLCRMAADRQIPILGICRGIQVLTAALDGLLYQDLPSQFTAAPLIKHSQKMPRTAASHTVRIEEGSLLASLFADKSGTLAVNSFHHQAVKTAGPHLRVCAYAPDGVIEAVESAEHKPILGVQWHPECFVLGGDETMLPLFRWLTKEADLFCKAKAIHRDNLTLDSHCDTPMCFEPQSDGTCSGTDFFRRDASLCVDLQKLYEGGPNTCIMAAYIPQGERTPEGYQAATERAERMITQVIDWTKACPEHLHFARNHAELNEGFRLGKKNLMVGIENGYALGRDLSLIKHFADKGVVYITLCHNGDNDLCDSARGRGEHGGLGSLGRQAVREMNARGIMVDLSHAAESTFRDVLDLSTAPVICSHSSARALCDVPRNLTDDQLRALARKDGVAQVTLYHGFLRREGEASILDALDHLDHMVRIMGIEHVGFGSDFDGDGGVPGCRDASEVLNFTRHLLARRYSADDLRLLWGENFLRVMDAAQAMSHSH